MISSEIFNNYFIFNTVSNFTRLKYLKNIYLYYKSETSTNLNLIKQNFFTNTH